MALFEQGAPYFHFTLRPENYVASPFSIEKMSSLWWWIHFLKNSLFNLKAQILSLAANTVSCFP